ncbi:MAG: NAD(P)/FAD-dependent oxidoreductase [Acidobacteria bacterium]|nr:NAD(P)/FAD-dependent oxidoreductase [Acidobacteriota bacterium]
MLSDALVVGGGPAGLYAAWRLAQSGHEVVVCEEHERIGDPPHCTGVVSAGIFDEFALPRDTILNPLNAVAFVSPSGLQVRYAPARLEAVAIDRPAFDRRLAAQAAAAGAQIRLGTRVDSLSFSSTGVHACTNTGAVAARLVVLASGAAYRLHRALDLGVPSTYLHTAQRELPASAVGDVEVHFGTRVAPGGFAWAVPVARAEGPGVRVGVMATHQAPGWYQAMLDRLMPRWGIERRGEDQPRLKFLPLRALQRTYADRLLVVGDAAGLVKPTTGGGIYYSVLSAALAAEVAAPALTLNRLQASALRQYQSRWRRRLAGEFQAQQLLRQLAQRMSDRQIDALFELALTDGVMPIVARTASFNQHRPLISALLRHAPARRIFWPARTAP